MNSNDMMQKFHKKLSLQGYVGKIVNAKRIPDLKNDIKKRHEQNLIFPQLTKGGFRKDKFAFYYCSPGSTV
jgi:hypothetical protein